MAVNTFQPSLLVFFSDALGLVCCSIPCRCHLDEKGIFTTATKQIHHSWENMVAGAGKLLQAQSTTAVWYIQVFVVVFPSR